MPLIFVLDDAFYMNRLDLYFDETGAALHLAAIFIHCYPWVFITSVPAAILLLAALIGEEQVKERQADWSLPSPGSCGSLGCIFRQTIPSRLLVFTMPAA